MNNKHKTKKSRLDELLVSRGLVDTIKDAQAVLMAGNVTVNGAPASKPGDRVPEDAALSLKEENPYVSRGGLKLASVFHLFPVSVEGKVCMDVGASTGGFTDFLLQHGAQKVYAIDVGEKLLHYRLRNNPRVVNLEGINFRYFSQDRLKEQVEFVTIDVSFISLEKILPVVIQCLLPHGDIIAMVKPQFEALPHETDHGVVKDQQIRKKTIQKIITCAEHLGLKVCGAADSSVSGPCGNLEHFLWLKRQ